MSTYTILQHGGLEGFLPREMRAQLTGTAGGEHREEVSGAPEDAHGFVLEMAHGFIKTQILQTSVSLGVFEALHEDGESGMLSLETVSEMISVPALNAERLLNTLVALKLIKKETKDTGIRYSGTALTLRYLTRRSDKSLVPVIDMASFMASHMSNLESCLKTPGWFESAATDMLSQPGGPPMGPPPPGMGPPPPGMGQPPVGPPVPPFSQSAEENKENAEPTEPNQTLPLQKKQSSKKPMEGKTPTNGHGSFEKHPAEPAPKHCFDAMEGQLKVLQAFQGAMNSYAVNATHLLDDWNVQSFSSAVDLGGGLGTFGKHLAAQHSHIQTTIVDIPPVVALAQMSRSEQEASLENLHFAPGDFFKGDLPKADIYILGHILHDWTETECQTILDNVVEALNPGGVVVILEKLLWEAEDGPLCPILMDLVMLLSTPGKERTLPQYTNLLANSGLYVNAVRQDDSYSWYDVIVASTSATTKL